MFLKKRLGGRAPPQLGWEGGGGGEEPQAAGYRRSRRSAAGASRLHSDVPAEQGGARKGLRSRQGRRTALFGLPRLPGKLRDSGQRADA